MGKKSKVENALKKHLNKAVPENDKYWDLFLITKEVNNSILEAYKQGFRVGYKTALKDKFIETHDPMSISKQY